MSFLSEFAAQRENISNIFIWFNENKTKLPKSADAFISELGKLNFLMSVYDNGPENTDFGKEYFAAYQRAMSALGRFAQSLDLKAKGNTEILRRNLNVIIPAMAKHEQIAARIKESFDVAEVIKKKLSLGEAMPLTEPILDFTGPSGHRPGFDDCLNVSLDNTDFSKYADMLFWLETRKANLTDEEAAENALFEETRKKMEQEIINALPGYHVSFASLMLLQNRRISRMPEGPEKEAAQRGLAGLKSAFSGTRMERMLDIASPEYTIWISPDKVTEKSSSLSFNDRMGALGKIYETLAKDGRDASPSFDAVRSSLKEFSALDPKTASEGLYRRKMSKAIDCAAAYLRDHRKVPYLQKGKERVAVITQLHTLLSTRSEEMERERQQKLSVQIDEQITAANNTGNDYGRRTDEIIKLAKLQANISPTKLIAKPMDFKPGQSEASLKTGSRLHKAFSVMYATLGTILGGITYALLSPFHASFSKPKIQTLQKDHIPGYGKDTFFDKIKPDEGPDNQELITDVRRVPLLFETEIPEDPDQGPTLSLNICQDAENDARSVVLGEDENGRLGTRMGHGFVSLCYSKFDPISGTKKRYKTSFGFYPKGGFQKSGHVSAMLMEGRHVPGQIIDDRNHDYTVSETYSISNKQFNKIILAAQNYADEGYNYTERNCAGFVRDMAVLGGIDVSKTFVKTDLTSNFMGAPLTLLGTFGGHLLKKFSDNDYKKKAEVDDTDYFRFGNKLVTDNEMKLLKKDQFNMRLLGYSPAHISMSMKAKETGNISSLQYKGFAPSYDDKTAEKQKGHYRLMCAKEEFGRFQGLLASMGVEQNIINDFSSFAASSMEALEPHVLNVFTASKQNEDGTFGKESLNVISKSCFDGTKAADAFVEGLNRIYHETFKNHADLTVPFTHLISVITSIKKEFAEVYSDLHSIFASGKNPALEGASKKGFSKIDISRDTSIALESLSGPAMTYRSSSTGKTRNISYNMVYGLSKAFGTLEKGVEADARIGELNEKEKNHTLSSAEKKEHAALKRKGDLALAFAHSAKDFLGRKSFTKEEINFFFNELPAQEEAVGAYGNSYTAARLYQSFVLETFMGGSKKPLEDAMEKLFNDAARRYEQLYSSINETNAEQVNNEIFEYTLQLRKQCCEAADSFFIKKFTDDNKVMPMIEEAVISRVSASNPVGPDTNPRQYEEDIKNSAAEDIYEGLIVSYADPLMNNIALSLRNKLPKGLHKEIYNKLESVFTESYGPNSYLSYPEVAKRREKLREHMFGKALSPEEINSGGKPDFSFKKKEEIPSVQ